MLVHNDDCLPALDDRSKAQDPRDAHARRFARDQRKKSVFLQGIDLDDLVERANACACRGPNEYGNYERIQDSAGPRSANSRRGTAGGRRPEHVVAQDKWGTVMPSRCIPYPHPTEAASWSRPPLRRHQPPQSLHRHDLGVALDRVTCEKAGTEASCRRTSKPCGHDVQPLRNLSPVRAQNLGARLPGAIPRLEEDVRAERGVQVVRIRGYVWIVGDWARGDETRCCRSAVVEHRVVITSAWLGREARTRRRAEEIGACCEACDGCGRRGDGGCGGGGIDDGAGCGRARWRCDPRWVGLLLGADAILAEHGLKVFTGDGHVVPVSSGLWAGRCAPGLIQVETLVEGRTARTTASARRARGVPDAGGAAHVPCCAVVTSRSRRRPEARERG